MILARTLSITMKLTGCFVQVERELTEPVPLFRPGYDKPARTVAIEHGDSRISLQIFHDFRQLHISYSSFVKALLLGGLEPRISEFAL